MTDKRLAEFVRPGLSLKQILEIKSAYDLFDIHGLNKVNPKDLQICLIDLGLDSKNVTLYSMLTELEQYVKYDLIHFFVYIFCFIK